MARFKVYGADAETGADVERVITADSIEDAEAVASSRGILIARMVELESAALPSPGEHDHVPRPRTPVYSQASPSGHDALSPTINVNTRKGSSSVGIVAFILGALAFMFCWVPFVGVLSVPLSGIGGLMAVMALIIALARKGAGVGWPVGAVVINGLALAVGIVQVAAISSGAEAVSDAVQEVSRDLEAQNRESEFLANDWRPPAGFEKSEIGWAVRAAYVTPVKLKTFEGLTRSQEKHLHVLVRVTNSSPNRKLDIDQLQGDVVLYGATLKDDIGNRYRSISFGLGTEVVGGTSAMALQPGASEDFVLVFERPVEAAKELILEIPAERFGGKGTVRLVHNYAS